MAAGPGRDTGWFDDAIDAWTPSVTALVPAPGIVVLELDDGGLLLAHESAREPVLLGALEAQFWYAIAGGSSIAVLEADARWLAGELGWSETQTLELLHGLLWTLDGAGLLVGARTSSVRPAPRFAALDPTSDAGVRMGLREGALFTVVDADGESGVHLAVGDPEVAERITATCPWPIIEGLPSASENGIPHVGLRLTAGARHQVFGPIPSATVASHDEDLVLEVFGRSVAGLMASRLGGIWSVGTALVRGDRLVLVHPRIAERLTGTLTELLEWEGIRVAPTFAVELVVGPNGAFEARAPSDCVTGRPECRWTLTGMVLPVDDDVSSDRAGASQLLAAADVLARWDPPHLEALPTIVSAVPVVEVGASAPNSYLFTEVVKAMGR